MEGILLDTMFDLPGLDGVEEVVINREVVEGRARPLFIYAERRASASGQRLTPALERRSAAVRSVPPSMSGRRECSATAAP